MLGAMIMDEGMGDGGVGAADPDAALDEPIKKDDDYATQNAKHRRRSQLFLNKSCIRDISMFLRTMLLAFLVLSNIAFDYGS